ncbi:MAG: hypothetical protein WCI20_03210 [bacterium]
MIRSYEKLTEQDRDLLLTGLSPEVDEPVALYAEPPPARLIPRDLPVTDFRNGEVLTEWLCAHPIAGTLPRSVVLLARGLSDPDFADEARTILSGMKPLDARYVVPESYPDFTPAVDLRAMANGADGVQGLFATAVRVESPRFVRVCHGAVGEGVTVHFFMDGLAIPHGGYVRMATGTHVLAMQTCSGQVRYTWQWPERRVGIRFDEINGEDLAALTAWQRGRWQETHDAAMSDERATLDGIDIDPATVVGRDGFIRVGRSRGGLWWLLDAEGRPFYYRAMCSVNNRNGYGGRRKGDPALSPEMVRHWIRGIKAQGFNGLGSWTTREFFDKGLYFTEIIETFYEGPYLQEGSYRYGVVPDVFDPEWARRLDLKCRDLCAPLADSQLLVGYFLDNERDFLLTRKPAGITGPVYRVGGAKEERRLVVEAEPIQNPEKLGLLQLALSLPPSKPAVQAAWRFVEDRYGSDLASLGAAWGITVASRLTFNEMTINGERLISDAYLNDEREFARLFLRRFFDVSIGAIRRYDPNHLVIGLRWAGIPDAVVLEEEARVCDIISVNRYRVHMAEAFDATYRRVNKPLLVGECEPINDSFRYVRDPIEPPGGYENETVRNETRAYETLNRLFAHPGIVGYTFYAWKNASLHPDMMRPVQQANWRAGKVRARREQEPVALTPLHGQIFVILVGLPHDILCLGFICRDGIWDPAVYGDGIRGWLTHFHEASGTICLELTYSQSIGMFMGSPSEGQCRIELASLCSGKLAGTFTGTFSGVQASGVASAFLHRPIPNREL